MICVTFQNEIVKSKSLLLQSNFNLKAKGSKEIRKTFEGSQLARNEYLKPAVNVPAHFVGTAVSEKTKNPKVAGATTNVLKSISGGKISSLKDLHGNGLRLKVM